MLSFRDAAHHDTRADTRSVYSQCIYPDCSSLAYLACRGRCACGGPLSESGWRCGLCPGCLIVCRTAPRQVREYSKPSYESWLTHDIYRLEIRGRRISRVGASCPLPVHRIAGRRETMARRSRPSAACPGRAPGRSCEPWEQAGLKSRRKRLISHARSEGLHMNVRGPWLSPADSAASF